VQKAVADADAVGVDRQLPDAHRCFITTGAGGRIDPTWCTTGFAPTLRALPPDLTEATIARPELLVCADGPVSIYFVPLDLVNPSARVLLVGLTPGRRQMYLAVTTAAAALRAGQSIDQALLSAKQAASFAGTMRANLVAMLDGIGLHRALELPSSAALFADRHDLVAPSSAICHAVFIDGRNYAGAPRVDRHPLLRAFARQVLATNLAMTPDALVIPLGQATARAVALTGVDPRRVLRGLPHPSGANGHRRGQYVRAREAMARTVASWFG
jgi:hypothetical protein